MITFFGGWHETENYRRSGCALGHLMIEWVRNLITCVWQSWGSGDNNCNYNSNDNFITISTGITIAITMTKYYRCCNHCHINVTITITIIIAVIITWSFINSSTIFKLCLPIKERVQIKIARHIPSRCIPEHMGISPLIAKKVSHPLPSNILTHSIENWYLISFHDFSILSSWHSTRKLLIRESPLISKNQPSIDENIVSVQLALFYLILPLSVSSFNSHSSYCLNW